VRPVSLANTVQDPHVLHVLLEHIKQRHLEQLPVPPVLLVSQDPPMKRRLVLRARIGRVRHVAHVPQGHGEVRRAQQRRTQDVQRA